MENQQKVNEIAKTLGYFLLERGVPVIQSAYKDLKPTIFSFGKIKDAFIANDLSNLAIGEYDVNYAFLDAQTLEPLVWDVMTLLHKFGYKYNVTDCDDFAFFCSCLMAFLYGINTCGVCLGEVYDNQTSAKIGGHYFNIPITYDPIFKKFEIWCADPLNPGFVRIEKENPIIINNWRYGNFQNVKYF